MAGPALHGKLLCVCGFLHPDVPPDPGTDFKSGAGFLSEPTIFMAGDFGINAALVGEIDEGFVVAFRGTLSFNPTDFQSIVDWVNDVNAIPTSFDTFPGSMHLGFFSAFQSVRDAAWNKLKSLRDAKGDTSPVWVTGHSKGGAMAPLAAWDFQENHQVPVEVVTFAAPRVGDVDFLKAYNPKIAHTRYEYNDDIVPHVAPRATGFFNLLSDVDGLLKNVPGLGTAIARVQGFDYQSVGFLQFIDDTGQIVGDSDTLEATRNHRLKLLIADNTLGSVADALASEVGISLGLPTMAVFGTQHSISCGSGYMSIFPGTGACS